MAIHAGGNNLDSSSLLFWTSVTVGFTTMKEQFGNVNWRSTMVLALISLLPKECRKGMRNAYEQAFYKMTGVRGIPLCGTVWKRRNKSSILLLMLLELKFLRS